MRTNEFINSIEKENGKNRYWICVNHITYSEPTKICFGDSDDDVTEYYKVHYGWKNAKRSMSNLTMTPTRTLEESLKLIDKKIKDLENKIK